MPNTLFAIAASALLTFSAVEPVSGNYFAPSPRYTSTQNACLPAPDLVTIESWLAVAWQPHGMTKLEAMCQCLTLQHGKTRPHYNTCLVPSQLSSYKPSTILSHCPCFEQLAGYTVYNPPSSSKALSSTSSRASSSFPSRGPTALSHSASSRIPSSSSTSQPRAASSVSHATSTSGSSSSSGSTSSLRDTAASKDRTTSARSTASSTSELKLSLQSVDAPVGSARGNTAVSTAAAGSASFVLTKSGGNPSSPILRGPTPNSQVISSSSPDATSVSSNLFLSIPQPQRSTSTPTIPSSAAATSTIGSRSSNPAAASGLSQSESRGGSTTRSSSSAIVSSIGATTSIVTSSPTSIASSDGSTRASSTSSGFTYDYLPGSTSTFDGPYTLAPAPTQTLTPAPPYGLDQGSPSVLIPQPNIQLWYGAPANASANITASYARLNITYDYPAVALDHSIYISQVTCADASITAAFNNTNFYSLSKSLWTANSTMLWITAAPSCATQPGVNTFFLCSSIDCDDASSSCTAHGSQQPLANILHSMDTDFGSIEQSSSSSSSGTGCGDAPAPTISNLPAFACSTSFDKQVDDALGYYAGDMNYVMNQFAPMPTSARLMRRKISFSKAWSAIKSTGKAIANAGSSAYHAAKSFAQAPAKTILNAAKSGFNYLASKGKDILKSAASFAGNVLKTALKLQIAFYKTLYAAAKFLVTGNFDDDVDLPFSLGPPSFLLLESPFMNNAKGFKFYEWRPDPKDRGYKAWDNALEVISQELINTNTASKPGIEFWCVGCGVQGDLKASGHVHVDRHGLQEATLSMKGNMYAGVFLGVNAFATYNKTYTKPLFVAGLPVLSIPDIFAVGPYVELDIRAEARIDALGQAIAGGSFTWPNISAVLDMKNSSNTRSSGFKPQINATIQATEQVTLTLSLGIPITLAVGINLLDGLYKKNINLTDTPALVATARVQDVINTTFADSCTTVDVTPTTQCYGVAWNVSAVNDVTLGLPGFDTFNLDHWESPALAEGCIGRNTTTHNITTTASNCPDPVVNSSVSVVPQTSSMRSPSTVASATTLQPTWSISSAFGASTPSVSPTSALTASGQATSTFMSSMTSSCVASPSSVITNGAFAPIGSNVGFQSLPQPWTGNGAAFYFDCSSPDAMFDNPECGWGNQERYVEYLCSQDAEINEHTASISEPLTGLIPGSPYQLIVTEAFDNSATCILSYMIDNVPFRSFKPTNTYQSSTNQMLYINDTAWFVPTSSSHTLTILMDCPYAGDNGGYGKWQAVDVQGPYCSSDMPISASNAGCPLGYVNGPTDRSESLYNVACNAAYGGTFLASSGEPSLDACLDWCNSWGNACQAVNFQNSYCTLYSTKDTVTPGSGAQGQTIATRF